MPAQLTSSSGQVYPVVHGYHIVRPIGGGGFSRVFRAINPAAKRHQVAAIKLVHYALPSANSTRQQHPPDRKALQKEVQLHAVLKHPAVLEFIAVEEVGVGKTGELAAAKANHVAGLYMVLELAVGGDLFDKIPPDVGLEEELAHFYFHQLMAALEYIHGQGITHRDVKPENLLLDAEGNLKLADFGLCGVYKYKGKERELNGACGSLPYIAPEMNGKPYRGEPVDVWSSGAVLFAMLVGNTPWDEPTARSAEYNAYLTGELFEYDPWPRLSSDMLSLVRKMLCPDPNKRITLAQVKQHRWYKRPNDLLESGLCRDPVSLAERLLHGLIVSGDLAFDLHTDGERAKVPETVSLTQPEWNGRSSKDVEGDWGDWRKALPPSSAVPALGSEASKQRRKRQEAFSQQIELRRAALPAATAEAQKAGAPASQFTQALNHYTQWSTLAIGKARFSPHLTRFFCTAEPAEITTLLVKQLSSLRVQNDVQGLGEQAEGDVIKDEDGDIEMAMEGEAGDAAKPDAGDASKLPRSGSGGLHLAPGAIGSRGTRIRLATTDQRKCVLKGDIRIEALAPQAGADLPEGAVAPRTMVYMGRSRGSPMEWRRLFRALTREPAIRATILNY